MIRTYVGIAAIVLILTTAACSSPEPGDFGILRPAPGDGESMSFIGPGIWESVPAHQETFEGTVEYLIEALDKNDKVVASYPVEFKRPFPDIARDKPLLSELVTILLATGKQMQNPVPAGFLGIPILGIQENPRYCFPPNAVAVRMTVDPDNKIKESNENNNTRVLVLPSTLYDQGMCPSP